MKSLPVVFEKLFQNEVISIVELEFVRFLLQLDENINQDVLLAAAACIHAQLNGHVCLDISKLEGYLFNDSESKIKVTPPLCNEWIKALSNSKLVSTNGELQPLVLDDNRLYLHRFWKYEQELASWIREKSEQTNKPDKVTKQAIQKILKNEPGEDVNWQQVALILSFVKDLVVISGGPGTGKTFAVLNIIAAHVHHKKDQKFKVALAAPTGKAARRLTESIISGKEKLPDAVKADLEITDTALTVHKLLGSDFHGSEFKFNEQNKLPFDLIVVDEASMLDITMWIRLVRAIPQNAKLIVLGDKDQLASVEAGSILGDICGGDNSFSADIVKIIQEITGTAIQKTQEQPAINDSVVFLTKSYRFTEQSGIQKLANAINNSDADEAISLLESSEYPDLRLLEATNENMQYVIKEFATNHFLNYRQQNEVGRLSASNKKKILCALRKGPFGVEFINAEAEQKIRREIPGALSNEWYSGRIIIAKRNDYVLKIRNGEIGICIESEDNRVEFEGENKIRVSAGRLQQYEPAYALTVHKSQGSEFNEVAIVLPNTMNSILSKEILYTGVTRARQTALVIGNKDIIKQTIENSVARSSGLKNLIWQK